MIIVLCVAFGMRLSAAVGGVVEVGEVYASAGPGVYWSSMRTKTRQIALDWPTNATKANLSIRGLSQKEGRNLVIPSGTEFYSWTPFVGESPDRDELYTLTLSYLDNANTVVGSVQTAEVVVVRSAFAATDLLLDTQSPDWKRASVSTIVPYDANWFTNVSADGVSTLVREKSDMTLVTETALPGAGWFGWNFARSGFGSSGTFRLSLTNGAEEERFDAELCVTGPGFLLLFR